MRKIVLFIFLLTASLLAKDYALIIGVSNYKNMRSSLDINNDIKIYKKILKNRGVENIKVLKNKKATRSAITKYLTYVHLNIKKYPNSRFFMFFTGHGISANTRGLKYNPSINRYLTNSGVILPYEYNPKELSDTIIIGKRDLRPYLIEIDKYLKESLIIFDACYAGNSIRGKNNKKRTPFIYSNSKNYPYNNIVYIASSTPRNKAKSGVLSKVLDGCLVKKTDLTTLRVCMNDKLKFIGQRAVVLAKK